MHVVPKENGGIGRHIIVHDQITKSNIRRARPGEVLHDSILIFVTFVVFATPGLLDAVAPPPMYHDSS